ANIGGEVRGGGGSGWLWLWAEPLGAPTGVSGGRAFRVHRRAEVGLGCGSSSSMMLTRVPERAMAVSPATFGVAGRGPEAVGRSFPTRPGRPGASGSLGAVGRVVVPVEGPPRRSARRVPGGSVQ